MSLNLRLPCPRDGHLPGDVDHGTGDGPCCGWVLTDAEALDLLGVREIDVVFDGPPGPVCGRFVETETPDGKGVGGVGEWIDRGDGMWALRIRAAVAADEEEGDDG